MSPTGIRHEVRQRVNSLGKKTLYGPLARAVQQAIRSCATGWLVLSIAAGWPASASTSEPTGNSAGDIVVSGTGRPPALWFASDGSASELESMFSTPGVISDLAELKAGVALAVSDLSADRARIVRQLNQAGIPVTAWLTLPADQGYYLNSSNAPLAAARFADFEKWSSAERLQWAAIGLDMEPSLQEFASLKQGGKWHLVSTMIMRLFDGQRVRRATSMYSALIREMQAHGYRVQTYQFPFIADERRVQSTVLERIGGIVDVKGDEEVLMLYTSFAHQTDSALIWVYGPDAQAIAIGSTSGPDSDPRFVRLNWLAFSRDVIVANHFSHTVGVYNLQGCIRQGFLSRLKTVNWDEPVTIQAESVQRVTKFRTRIQRVLWIASHILYFAVALLIALAWIVVRWNNRLHRSRTPSLAT